MVMCWLKSKLVFTKLVVYLSACKHPERADTQVPFYTFDSLIDAQVNYFAKAHPVLKKYAEINGRRDSTEHVPADSASWASELEIFKQIDFINKPVNKDKYKFEDGLPDVASNLTICKYTALKDLPIRYVIIYYQQDHKRIRRVEASYRERNGLYTSARLLTFDMQDIYNKTVLTSYSITGGQKMLMGDSTRIRITGILHFQ